MTTVVDRPEQRSGLTDAERAEEVRRMQRREAWRRRLPLLPALVFTIVVVLALRGTYENPLQAMEHGGTLTVRTAEEAGRAEGEIGSPTVTRNGWRALLSVSWNRVMSRSVGWITSKR